MKIRREWGADLYLLLPADYVFPHPNVLVSSHPALVQEMYVHPQHAEQEGKSFVFWRLVVLIVGAEFVLDGVRSRSLGRMLRMLRGCRHSATFVACS